MTTPAGAGGGGVMTDAAWSARWKAAAAEAAARKVAGKGQPADAGAATKGDDAATWAARWQAAAEQLKARKAARRAPARRPVTTVAILPQPQPLSLEPSQFL